MMRLIGYRPYKFTDERTGEVKQGVTIHAIDFESAETDDEIVGNAVFKGSVSCKVFDNLCSGRTGDSLIGVDFDPVYDKRGKIKGMIEQES